MLDVMSASSLIEQVSRDGASNRQSGFWSRKMVAELLALTEAGLVIICAIIAKIGYINWYLGDTPPLAPYLSVAILGSVFVHFLLKRYGLYDLDSIIKTVDFAKRILFGLSVSFLVLIAIGYIIKDAHFYSRGWLLIWFLTSFGSLLVVRMIAMAGIKRLVSQGYFQRSVAIYGAGSLGMRLYDFLAENDLTLDLVGVFDDRISHQARKKSKMPILGGLEDLIAVAHVCHIDRIIIALPAPSDSRIKHLFSRLNELPSDVHLCPNMSSFELHHPRIDYIGSLGLLEVHSKPIGEWNVITKAALDYTGSALALVVLSPVFALAALAIKLDSPGPVFFRQRRHGFNQEIINVLKFRTMTVMEDGPEFQQAARNDPRVTRVGKFFRRTSIDELPQFWNVFLGEMSIVGPRPHAVAHNEQFFSVFKDFATRHKVKPGITGWAQINGYRGETDTADKMRGRVDHDLAYIKNWSIWLDLRIIMKTIYVVLRGTNAH
jgi:Undecaprenyl-phosphate glucose phosphotransferase